ncbi:hypothetical protein DPEC_G00184770 [Dallia pectoralis]|uniref:Uncharacterized protein n=1 Tax=Dallia pectoralis TaxID=75939 RepID=A0ACC2GBI1_DALPE|nr:hypothetical protein DPEC_G00184770 [Dallia pectoralis]
MSTREEMALNQGAAVKEEDDDAEHESAPPVVTRTRSGRRVRTPVLYVDSEVPKTPTRRTRKSVIHELPNETESELERPVLVEPVADEPREKESRSRATRACPQPVHTDTPAEESCAGTVVLGVTNACIGKENKGDAVRMETVPGLINKTGKKRTHSESNEKLSLIPLGKPKSGRVWKDRNKQRFSALVRDKPLRSSWEKKMEAKQEKVMVKKYSQQLKEDKAREKAEKRKRHEENLKRREENERKAEVTQVIRNTAKIKRMKKKQLRRIEKRDTLTMVQKSQPKTQQKSHPKKPKVAKKVGDGDK